MIGNILHWQTNAGEIRLLPSRGRMLGITLRGHEALWAPGGETPPWNLGGERLWIGPERDWFWQQTHQVDFSQYLVPPGLSPDLWQVHEATDERASAQLDLMLKSAHSANVCGLRIRRSWELLKPDAFSIGVRATTRVEILDGTPGQPIDLWSLLQIPPGGEIRMPVPETPAPRDYFDPCPPGEFDVRDGNFHLRIGGPSIFKIGISPNQSSGKITYVRPVPEGILELTREFPIDPEQSYCDSPLTAHGTQGDAVQFFNDGGQYGGFGELEHHSPALRCGVGPQAFSETTNTTVRLRR